MVDSKNWFKSWFNSPYYHILYDKRDKNEARLFLDNLTQFLKPEAEASILDLACGKGRHSIYLNNLGYNVIGLDLSVENIKYARQYENSRLHFFEGDMRSFSLGQNFDIIFNLFTSFGYFKEEKENVKVIRSISENLKSEGKVVLDYLNCKKINDSLPSSDIIVKNGIEFNITKKNEDHFIVKEIRFNDQDNNYLFKEYVKMIDLQVFQKYFETAGLRILNVFGDYNLNSYNSKESDRLILIAEKKF